MIEDRLISPLLFQEDEEEKDNDKSDEDSGDEDSEKKEM